MYVINFYFHTIWGLEQIQGVHTNMCHTRPYYPSHSAVCESKHWLWSWGTGALGADRAASSAQAWGRASPRKLTQEGGLVRKPFSNCAALLTAHASSFMKQCGLKPILFSGFMKKMEFLTFHSRKWFLFLIAYIAYTFKLVILRPHLN